MTTSQGLKMNHVALSMLADDLTGARRNDIARFYGEVFGWTEYVLDDGYVAQFGKELSSLTGRRVATHEPLVLLTGPGSFLFLYALDRPAVPALADHFGFEVATEAELDGVLDRAKAFARHDGEVHITDKAVWPSEVNNGLLGRDAGSRVDLVNCYIGYRLPYAVEVQHYRWA